jgi:hypothetical protein
MKYAILVLALALLAFLVIDFNSRTAELNRLTAERETVNAKLNSRLGTKEALERQIAYATSEAAVYDWAYEDGHMIHSGDYPIIPIQPVETTPIPTPRPPVQQTELSNWQRWLALFVDIPYFTKP